MQGCQELVSTIGGRDGGSVLDRKVIGAACGHRPVPARVAYRRDPVGAVVGRQRVVQAQDSQRLHAHQPPGLRSNGQGEQDAEGETEESETDLSGRHGGFLNRRL